MLETPFCSFFHPLHLGEVERVPRLVGFSCTSGPAVLEQRSGAVVPRQGLAGHLFFVNFYFHPATALDVTETICPADLEILSFWPLHVPHLLTLELGDDRESQGALPLPHPRPHGPRVESSAHLVVSVFINTFANMFFECAENRASHFQELCLIDQNGMLFLLIVGGEMAPGLPVNSPERELFPCSRATG